MVKASRFLCIGIGGKRCPCCFPVPGSKARKAAYKVAKRKEKRLALRIEAQSSGGFSEAEIQSLKRGDYF